jgi:protein-L-isoaspartate(D-aspartate) O-methyltransferase
MARSVSFAITAVLFHLTALQAGADPRPDEAYRKARLRMVERYVVKEGITHPAVLAALREVPRHKFVDPAWLDHAYEDQSLPIGHKQTITSPYLVAFMTQALDPRPTDRVLEVGTGSGYQAAVLARIVKDVYSVEIVEELGKEAAARLRLLGYDNVHTRVGDGYQGWAAAAPFDKIIVTCSPEKVPQPLIDQLAEGGRLVVPLGEMYQQTLYLFEKKDGKLEQKRLLPTYFVPMTGKSDEERRARPDPKNPELLNGGFERATDQVADAWHYQRQATRITVKAPEGNAYLSFRNARAGQLAQALQALAVDGASVRALKVGLWVRGEAAAPGTRPHELPGLVVVFVDGDRQLLEERAVGPWLGTFGWRRIGDEIPVPKDAREAVVRVGLNGATGRLSVDDIRLSALSR